MQLDQGVSYNYLIPTLTASALPSTPGLPFFSQSTRDCGCTWTVGFRSWETETYIGVCICQIETNHHLPISPFLRPVLKRLETSAHVSRL